MLILLYCFVPILLGVVFTILIIFLWINLLHIFFELYMYVFTGGLHCWTLFS